jgi:YD repeat-containing protein
MKSYLSIEGILERVEATGFDGLGRVLMVGVSNGGAQDWTRTEHDAAGRRLRTSNPRTLTLGSNQDLPTAGGFTRWTTNTYDALDRITRITTQDGQFVAIDYWGFRKTATDQASMKRRVNYDALGRISSAVEPNLSNNSFDAGAVTTSYTYDVLDNLTGVTQGTQTRSFAYDSLGRLTSATNPESGTTTYLYDANSNLTRKTDARGVQTNYNNYDALNRPGSISYSDGTPTATFTYDSVAVTNGKGRRTGMSDTASGTKTYHFDTMGRMSKIVWQTSDFTQAGEFVYNKLGGITQSKWPGIYDYGGTPLAIHRSYDNQGRQISARWSNHSSGGPGGTAYQEMVDNHTFVYGSTDPFATETTTYENGIVETIAYNDRLQPKQRTVKYGALFRLNQIVYFNRAGDNGNNGNVWEVDDQVDSAHGDMTYGYDWWNRITTFKIT